MAVLLFGNSEAWAGNAVQRVPLKLDGDWSFSFVIFPGEPTAFEFPESVQKIVLGNTSKFAAEAIGDNLVVLKAKTTERGLFTGLQVHFQEKRIVSLRLTTGDLDQAVGQVVFYRGASPIDQVIDREKKRLQGEFEKREKGLRRESELEIEQKWMAEVQTNYVQRDLSGGRMEGDIGIFPKQWIESGSRLMVTVEVRNESENDVEVKGIDLRAFRFGSFLWMKRKSLRSVAVRKRCGEEKLAAKKSTLCSMTFDRPALGEGRHRLSVFLPIKEGRGPEAVLPPVKVEKPETL